MSQELFYKFASEMSDLLSKSLVTYKDQKRLLDELVAVEIRFKKELLKTKRGKKMYAKFMHFIVREKKNKLAARIYFRERQDTFSNHISKAFYDEKPLHLTRFRINYWFIEWTVANHPNPSRKLVSMLEEVKSLRSQLCETNMPLAVNQAKIFWSKCQDRQLEYMDFIQACSEGLLNAIDKFVPPYRDVFKSTAIGRMLSNMLDDHNATLVKFSPKERRIIYRARLGMNKKNLSDIEDILKFVQESFPDVEQEYLRGLLNAATSPFSMSCKEEDSPDWDQLLADGKDTEQDLVDGDMKQKLYELMPHLTVIERKVISMTYGIIYS
jgi:DNA-directed RNA polymerase specialized sigma subunit